MFRQQSTLGETLAQQPGVSSTGFAPGSSRPIIRGLGQDRIRILENGLDSGDVSSIGPDHAVAIDTLSVERIEVVRGPGSVVYGSDPFGGIIHATTPSPSPEAFRGQVQAAAGRGEVVPSAATRPTSGG